MEDKTYTTFGRRKKNAPNHWEQIDLKTLKITKPVLVCLSGSATTDSAGANGFCRLAQSYAGKFVDKIDIVGASYGKEKGAKSGGFSKEDTENIVQNLLMPLCQTKDIDLCCKNLSQITFFTFCQGSIEMYNVANQFKQALKQSGFAEDDIKKMLSSMCEIGYSTTINTVLVPQISIGSTQDAGGATFGYYYGDEDFRGVATVFDGPNHYCGKNFPSVMPYQNFVGRQADTITIMASDILDKKPQEVYKNEQEFLTAESEPMPKEHWVGFLQKDENGDLMHTHMPNATYLSKSLDFALQARLLCSIKNAEGKNYVPFSLQKLYHSLKANIKDPNMQEKI